MRIAHILGVLILITILAVGCAPEIRSIQLDSDRTIILSPGEKIRIVLRGNPTTGYIWTADKSKLSGLLEESGESVYTRDSDLIGVGGLRTFTFKALDKGQTEIVFLYQRSWEKEPAKKYVLTIEIK